MFAPVAPRFWSKVRVTPGCWLWTANRLPAGYGLFSIYSRVDGQRRHMSWVAHRLAWTMVNGSIPEGLADCIGKGRWKHPPIARGERHYRAKLTAAQVLEIRARRAAGATHRALANEYGVTLGTIWALLVRRTWASAPFKESA